MRTRPFTSLRVLLGVVGNSGANVPGLQRRGYALPRCAIERCDCLPVRTDRRRPGSAKGAAAGAPGERSSLGEGASECGDQGAGGPGGAVTTLRRGAARLGALCDAVTTAGVVPRGLFLFGVTSWIGHSGAGGGRKSTAAMRLWRPRRLRSSVLRWWSELAAA